ncbi:hypothetical protein [Kitasatospora sp. NPDC098663]|uniref:hypothetical protein n=1 Tax=Kitasatospora sp. NPDC098663 TaxID=3364096 RepID=UPI00381B2389
MVDTEPIKISPNIMLAIAGGALLAAALAGFFLSLNSVVIGVLLPLGAFLLLASAFAPRLEGEQRLPGGGSLNLCSVAKPIENAERQITAGDVVEIEELAE